MTWLDREKGLEFFYNSFCLLLAMIVFIRELNSRGGEVSCLTDFERHAAPAEFGALWILL